MNTTELTEFEKKKISLEILFEMRLKAESEIEILKINISVIDEHITKTQLEIHDLI